MSTAGRLLKSCGAQTSESQSIYSREKWSLLLPPARGKPCNDSAKLIFSIGERDNTFSSKGEFCTVPTYFCFKPKSKILTLNCEGVSSMLKSDDAEIPSSRVSRNTF